MRCEPFLDGRTKLYEPQDLPRAVVGSQASSPIALDLGAVRGTIEVHLNGKLVEQRVFSPWTTDLTGHVTPGTNELEVRVFGTLGPHLHHTSPTSYILHTQRRTGWLGPARLLTSRPS